MKKKIIILIIALLLVIGGAGFIYNSFKSNSSGDSVISLSSDTAREDESEVDWSKYKTYNK